MNISYKGLLFILSIVVSINLIDAKTVPYSEYAYIYNFTTQKIKQGAAATFDSHGQITSGIKHDKGSSDIILSDGVYLVTFYALGNMNTFGLFLNGKSIEGGTYGSYKSGQLSITGQAIIKAEAGSILTLRHYSPYKELELGSASLNISGGDPVEGQKKSVVNASIIILKLN